MTTPDEPRPATAARRSLAARLAEFPLVRPITDARERRLVRVEIVIVLAITLGLSGVRSLLSLVESLLRTESLAEQSVALNASAAQADLIDLAFQLTRALQLFAWGALGVYLLARAGLKLRDIGLARRVDGRDWLYGAGLAALIGVPGLAFYLVARAVGANLTVLPSALDDTWWRVPVLVLAAIGNSWAEEVLVVGYLLTRLRQLDVGAAAAIVGSAVLRGSYHLYQGFGGFLGNVVMGLVFALVWHRSKRLWPLVIAHSVIDVVAFVGYALLRGRVGWLP